jgi:CRISPR system Cascade subunit CasB
MMETENIQKKASRGTRFVQYVLKKMEQNTAVGAAFRRADNPATEYQCWEYLANACDLDDTPERICFATVAAGLAHSKKSIDSQTGIGKVIALCYPEGNQDESAKRRLRRLLACDSGMEACQWVRTTLRLADSRGISLNFGRLLDDLLYFGPKVKERWATDFYGKRRDDDSLGA